MNKIKQILQLLCALAVIAAIPVVLSRREVIPTDMPALTREDIMANKQDYEKQEAKQEEQERSRRAAKARAAYSACTADEDCIIVDKDPCGCLVGPKGVTAINMARSLEFTKAQGNVMAKACPDGEPSQERECSPNARAVCRQKMCKIVY